MKKHTITVNGLEAVVCVPNGVELTWCRSLVPKAERVNGVAWTDYAYAYTVEDGRTLLHWTNVVNDSSPMVLKGDIGLKRFDPAPNGPREVIVRLPDAEEIQ